jgi:molybdate transport system substrate-binding protein
VPSTLIVFAAASLTDSFEAMAAEFEGAHPGVDIVLSFGASQALRAQIQDGARADVFASANWDEIKALVDAGLVEESATPIFARNRLVIVLPADNPAGVTSLQDLARPGVHLVVADPAVPAGKYTQRVLDSLGGDAAWGGAFRDGVLDNVVSQEVSVRAVLAKVEIGEADAGIVYASDASQAPGLIRLELPAEHNPVAEYPLAALRESPHLALAQEFVDFVLSPAGQRVMEGYGFLPAAD